MLCVYVVCCMYVCLLCVCRVCLLCVCVCIVCLFVVCVCQSQNLGLTQAQPHLVYVCLYLIYSVPLVGHEAADVIKDSTIEPSLLISFPLW